jgi:hypothetical protein
MRFYTFLINDEARLGVELPGQERLIDLSAAEPGIPNDLLSFIRGGERLIALAFAVAIDSLMNRRRIG